MKRLNKLIAAPEYDRCLAEIRQAENGRIFCGHDTDHFLDVSRILYIYCLERGLDLDKELIYAIGFLHDIGRAKQYSDGTDHHIASADIAAELMPRFGFTPDETALVARAILAHRTADGGDELSRLVYKADKKSRLCSRCAAADQCSWSDEKKNKGIEI